MYTQATREVYQCSTKSDIRSKVARAIATLQEQVQRESDKDLIERFSKSQESRRREVKALNARHDTLNHHKSAHGVSRWY